MDAHSADPFIRCLALGVPGDDDASIPRSHHTTKASKAVYHDETDSVPNGRQSAANNSLKEKMTKMKYKLT